MPETKEEKAKRLAEALRANLKRRKSQKRSLSTNDETDETDRRQFRTRPLTKS